MNLKIKKLNDGTRNENEAKRKKEATTTPTTATTTTIIIITASLSQRVPSENERKKEAISHATEFR